MIRKIGLTGGIASGKSSVASWFRAKGVPVFDADDAVHLIMAREAMISSIKGEFGPEYIQNGKINRVLFGNKVFQDPKIKKRLEELLHPLVLKEMEIRCREAEKMGEKIIILEIPLLFEAGWDKNMDEIWVVFVPYSIQVERLVLRNGFSVEEAVKRISSQMVLEEKVQKADKVIDNSGNWNETEKQLGAIWKEINSI
ncbi:MAG: Dephospho-CoA kinase [Candidatus Dichloromethanomonas elyunquensis]|nr:MAG: Dephospho-CoA kinase [Candidatus Dichloromethanomonas elyunquensis]